MSNHETTEDETQHATIPARMIVIGVKPLNLDTILFKGRLIPLSHVPAPVLDWLHGKTFQEAVEEIYSIIESMSYEAPS